MTTPNRIQPTVLERGYCELCLHWYPARRADDSVCCVTSTSVRPLGCPTAERSRESYNQSLQARRLDVGLSPYSTVAKHREPEEADNYENDCQTICYDCEETHQLSCLTLGQNGVPKYCRTYDARRAVIEGTPTSRYDIHNGLSNVGEALKSELPKIEEE